MLAQNFNLRMNVAMGITATAMCSSEFETQNFK